MRRRFTIQPAEVRQYFREGYLLKKRFIPENLLQQAILAGEQLAQQKTQKSENSGYLCLTNNALSKDPGFSNLLESLNLWRAAGALLGNLHLAYHFSKFTIKNPGQEGTVHWHSDFTNQHISLVASDFLRVFIPLSCFDVTNAALRIIKQSNNVTDSSVKLSKRLNLRTTRKFPLAQRLYCSPGDIIFIHPKARHCGDQNCSDRPGLNLILQLGIARRPVSKKISHKYPTI